VRQEAVGILGVVLPTNYIVDTEATSRDRLSAFFSIATVGVIIVGYFLAQSIARPILRLRAMSQAVAAGDLNQRTHLKRSDEIGELARAFDVMTYRLRRRTAQAARLYAETVRRNEELAAANQRLQATQQQLIQSEKLAAVGQLTAGIVHDVKNPLAVIKGMAEELQEDPGLSQDAREQLRTVRDNAARANTIVTDLLKFARQSQPEFRHQDFRETVQSAIRLSAYLARKAQVNVKLDAPLSPVMVSYDASQLEQVLINLMQNAIQAMPDGGQLQLTLTPGNSAVRLVVRDSGIGIPKDHLNRIFDPFFTTKPPGEGTGLGLSVSYGIVSRHRGRIEVQSMPGKGTAFTILLPIEQPSAQHAGIG
jgi:two-component system NtrC family sensor kinase